MPTRLRLLLDLVPIRDLIPDRSLYLLQQILPAIPLRRLEEARERR